MVVNQVLYNTASIALPPCIRVLGCITGAAYLVFKDLETKPLRFYGNVWVADGVSGGVANFSE